MPLNTILPLETLRRAARSLADTPLRTTLTVSGIAIGIAALFSLLSIAEGIRDRIVNEWLSSGLMTSLSVMPQGSPNPLRRGGPGRRPRTAVLDKPGETRRALDDSAMADIARIPGVRRVWPVISRPVMLTASGAGDEHRAATRSGQGGAPEGAKPAGAELARGSASASESKASNGAGSTAASEPNASNAAATNAASGPNAPHSTASTAASEPNASNAAATNAASEPKASNSAATNAASEPNASSSTAANAASGPNAPHSAAAAAASEPNASSSAAANTASDTPSQDAEYATLRGFDTDFFWKEDYLRISAGAPLKNPNLREALLSNDHLKGLGFKDAASAVGGTVLVRWREPVPAGTNGAEAVAGLPFFVAERSVPYKIVGVFEKRGALSLRTTGVIVSSEQARQIGTLDAERLRSLFEGGSTAAGYPALDVYLTPGADLEAIESRIKEMRFETLSGAEIVSRIRRSILTLQAVLGGLGAIAIAVATLGIANTLLTAVYERMREIGVMKAVGARRRDIRRQFFSEAGLIGLSGGIAGLLLGFGADHLLGLVIGQIARRQGGEDPGAIAVHTPMIAAGCLVFAVLLSLMAGTFPAARAARLDPVRMLRHE